MEKERECGMFATIPMIVLHDKELKDKAKLLYGEISSLCCKEGYCWATNNYFAERYGTTKETISKLISHLNQKGYVNVVLIKDEDTNQVIQRRIYIMQNLLGIGKNFNTPIEEKDNTPIVQKDKDNNKDKNNKNNNNSAKPKNEVVERLWKLYPRKKGKFKENTVMKIIKEIGEDQFERCIIRYAEECRKENKKEQYILLGTSFIGRDERYRDYMDENYQEGKSIEKKNYSSLNANTNYQSSTNINKGYGF